MEIRKIQAMDKASVHFRMKKATQIFSFTSSDAFRNGRVTITSRLCFGTNLNVRQLKNLPGYIGWVGARGRGTFG